MASCEKLAGTAHKEHVDISEALVISPLKLKLTASVIDT